MSKAISIDYKSFKKWKTINSLRSEKATLLLISYTRPHNSVPVDIIYLWLTDFLKLSGIDTTILTPGHSTRTAPVTKAKQVGLTLLEILKRGQWTNKTTFETFYNNPFVDNSVEVLQGK